MHKCFQLLIVVVAVLTCGKANCHEKLWRVGVARVNITPSLPIWLSGYGGRNRPSAEILDDLWAKALVFEDAAGNLAVLVTLDLVGIERELTRAVCLQVQKKHRLPRDAIALCTSHTHSGPIVRGNLVPMFALDADQTERTEQYAIQLVDKLVSLINKAIESLAPAQLSWSNGTSTFAVNRRNNPEGQVTKLREQNSLAGPVDHDVPVLAIHNSTGDLRAIVFGYACHATVLNGYQVSADWPGAAQNELEHRHPDTLAFFWAGCGADQNPLPRRSIKLMHDYGRQLADAIDRALSGSLIPITSTLRTAYEEIELPFGLLPTRAELELEAVGDSPRSRWARYMLSTWDQRGQLPKTYPYPVQAWHLGEEITWFFLGGEVVVDYSLRLKSEFGSHSTWVASYSNDVMGYIPSRRVLAEGGYEGGEARIPYGLPAAWDSGVEEQITNAASRIRASLVDSRH